MITFYPQVFIYCFIVFFIPILAITDIVKTQHGYIKGFKKDNVFHFNSIPYAAPPVGDLRFKPPQPIRAWKTFLNATKQPPLCIQFKEIPLFEKYDVKNLIGQEDCLYLNIYVPNNLSSSNYLPVMFFIHGGGFSVGSGYDNGHYDGANLSKDKNVIVVTINYRLSILGFFASESLFLESGSTGRYGIQDQQMALEWVSKNIHLFGGDPSRITLFGQSAGAASLCYHLTHDISSTPLYSSIIMESGSCSHPSFFSYYNDSIVYYELFAKALNCSSSPSSFQQQKQIKCLRNLTTSQLFSAISKISVTRPKNVPYLFPFVHDFITIDPILQNSDIPLYNIQKGLVNNISVIIGSNNDEGSFFDLIFSTIKISPNCNIIYISEECIQDILIDIFHNDTLFIERINILYPSKDFKNPAEKLSVLIRDVGFRCENRRIAKALASNYIPVYLYIWKYPIHWIQFKILGNAHTLELPFVFENCPDLTFCNDEDRKMMDIFSSYWSSMAYRKFPPSYLPLWSSYDHHHYLDLGLNPSMIYDGDDKKCDLFDQKIR